MMSHLWLRICWLILAWGAGALVLARLVGKRLARVSDYYEAPPEYSETRPQYCQATLDYYETEPDQPEEGLATLNELGRP